MKNYKDYVELLLESAPRLPKSEDYWLNKGKSGKNVCLIFHDDMDGICSAIIVKNYLKNQGFKIKQYGSINYQEGWSAFRIDKSLITIALDFAENIEGCDLYIDHHGVFEDEVKHSQKQHAIKTETGSAAEGIAQQLGVPFSNDTKDWIDMIDSAKYSDYGIDIKGILDFDLRQIIKSPNAKLKFAAAFNQLLKRSDHKTFIEVVNACDQPSIFNIYRLFKLFFPKNNPNFKTGVEPEFVSDAKSRLQQMQKRTKGEGYEHQGYDSEGKKIRYMTQQDFWNDFARNLPYSEVDDKGQPALDSKGEPIKSEKWQVKPGVYQLIGNLMYVPSGTWANALRAKAIFVQDLEKGIVPDDPKLNFVLLQYGNTLQIADISQKIANMNKEDLPKDRSGKPIDNLGKYMENLVKNFKEHLGYFDERTVAGGHTGIGSISNIFGKCKNKPYEGAKFLDMFKNKIINDISGVKWSLTMAWNEVEEVNRVIAPEEVNKKLVDIEDVRSEEDARIERDEREILNYLIVNDIRKSSLSTKFKNETMRKIYEIWLDTDFNEINSGIIKEPELSSIYFKKNKEIESSNLFAQIVKNFDLNDIYSSEPTVVRARQRKELKRIFRIIFNIFDESYIGKNAGDKVKKWMK